MGGLLLETCRLGAGIFREGFCSLLWSPGLARTVGPSQTQVLGKNGEPADGLAGGGGWSRDAGCA